MRQYSRKERFTQKTCLKFLKILHHPHLSIIITCTNFVAGSSSPLQLQVVTVSPGNYFLLTSVHFPHTLIQCRVSEILCWGLRHCPLANVSVDIVKWRMALTSDCCRLSFLLEHDTSLQGSVISPTILFIVGIPFYLSLYASDTFRRTIMIFHFKRTYWFRILRFLTS